MEFKTFLTESEENTDVQSTLRKIPESHRKLVAGYQFKFQPGNTLKHDKKSIGEIDEEKKIITVCAPWNYGRQFTFLHEIGHLVWKYIMDEGLRAKWKKAYNAVKHKQSQGMEEIFCMSYANYYAKNKVEIHNHKEWLNFIKNLPR
jgi:hypothetical protein